MLIGVDDHGRVVGLADADKVIESVLSACREAVSPPLRRWWRSSGGRMACWSWRKSRLQDGCMPRAAPCWSATVGRRGEHPLRRSGC